MSERWIEALPEPRESARSDADLVAGALARVAQRQRRRRALGAVAALATLVIAVGLWPDPGPRTTPTRSLEVAAATATARVLERLTASRHALEADVRLAAASATPEPVSASSWVGLRWQARADRLTAAGRPEEALAFLEERRARYPLAFDSFPSIQDPSAAGAAELR